MHRPAIDFVSPLPPVRSGIADYSLDLLPSQIKNRATAMKILRSRIYDLEMKKRADEQAKRQGAKKEIAWGSQIRSYVLHPYRMVKDHRTGVEVGDADGVLDGALDPFIDAWLREGMTSEEAESQG